MASPDKERQKLLKERERYHRHFRAVAAERRWQLRRRQADGWRIARLGAWILRQAFGAKRVVLFGSMLDLHRMNDRSDVDLAVWGLTGEQAWTAGAKLDAVSLYCGGEIPVDLIEYERARPYIQDAIINEGVELAEPLPADRLTLAQVEEGVTQLVQARMAARQGDAAERVVVAGE